MATDTVTSDPGIGIGAPSRLEDFQIKVPFEKMKNGHAISIMKFHALYVNHYITLKRSSF